MISHLLFWWKIQTCINLKIQKYQRFSYHGHMYIIVFIIDFVCFIENSTCIFMSSAIFHCQHHFKCTCRDGYYQQKVKIKQGHMKTFGNILNQIFVRCKIVLISHFLPVMLCDRPLPKRWIRYASVSVLFVLYTTVVFLPMSRCSSTDQPLSCSV